MPNACIEAACEAGATEFLVNDSHGNGQNLLIDQPPGYLRGVERIGSHTIRYEARAMVDASNFLAFVLGYSVSLTPYQALNSSGEPARGSGRRHSGPAHRTHRLPPHGVEPW